MGRWPVCGRKPTRTLGPATLVFLCGVSYSADLPTCISANDLAAQYGYDKAGADAKYKGKTLAITGLVEQKRIDPNEVDLKSDGLYLVRARGQNLTVLRAGQSVTLQCTGDGTVSPLTVSSCSIVPADTKCIVETKPVVHPGSPTFVELNLMPQLQAQIVLITGTTNLKDGAVLNYEVQHERYPSNLKSNLFADGNLVVNGGKYSGTVNVARWPPGKITVWIGFQTFVPKQPAWVKAQFGDTGQEMQGPTVKLAGKGVKRAELEKTLVKR
jgi:hypothetical protein